MLETEGPDQTAVFTFTYNQSLRIAVNRCIKAKVSFQCNPLTNTLTVDQACATLLRDIGALGDNRYASS